MKVRKLIEMLSKRDWNAEIRINAGLPSNEYDSKSTDAIRSITDFTIAIRRDSEKPDRKSIVTLNTFGLIRKY